MNNRSGESSRARRRTENRSKNRCPRISGPGDRANICFPGDFGRETGRDQKYIKNSFRTSKIAVWGAEGAPKSYFSRIFAIFPVFFLQPVSLPKSSGKHIFAASPGPEICRHLFSDLFSVRRRGQDLSPDRSFQLFPGRGGNLFFRYLWSIFYFLWIIRL